MATHDARLDVSKGWKLLRFTENCKCYQMFTFVVFLLLDVRWRSDACWGRDDSQFKRQSEPRNSRSGRLQHFRWTDQRDIRKQKTDDEQEDELAKNELTIVVFNFSSEMWERLAVSLSTYYIPKRRTACSKNGICGVRSCCAHSWRQFCKDHLMAPRMMVGRSLPKYLWLFGLERWWWHWIQNFSEETCKWWCNATSTGWCSILLSFRSFFQSVCVLGYCLTPLAVSLIICRAILVVNQTNFTFFLRLLTSTAGFLWATYASIIFMGDSQPPNRKALAVYPIFLFYFIISWLVVSHSN